MFKYQMRSLLSMNGISVDDVAEAFGLTHETFIRKLRTQTFTFKELERIAQMTGTALCLVDLQDVVVKAVLTEGKPTE